MEFNEKDLLLAQKKGVISADVFVELLNFLRELHPVSDLPPAFEPDSEPEVKPVKKKFTIENFLYYFGALLIIISLGWFTGNVWETFGAGGMLVLSISYFLIFTVIGNILWKKEKTIPGGLLYVCAVSIVPLAVWCFEKLIGVMPDNIHNYKDFHIWVRSGFIFMEIATIFAGLAFLKYRKFPFLTLPICYAMWYLSMDIVPLCVGNTGEPTWIMRSWTSLVFSFLLVGAALKYDGKYKEDFSGWLYIFGSTMLFFAVISVLSNYKLFGNEIVFLLFGLGSFLYMITSILLQRKVFMVWGALGVISYLGHLAYSLFKDSAMFPLSLIVLGLLIIFGGMYYTKNCNAIETTLRRIVLGK